MLCCNINFKVPSLRYFEVLIRLSWFYIKREFSLTHAGFLWWILEPVLWMFIYYLLFEIIFNIKTENYLIFVLTGLIIWRWMQTAMIHASSSIKSYRSLNLQFYVPKMIFPLQAVLINTYKYFVALIILMVVLLFMGKLTIINLAIYPAIFIVQLIFIIAASLLLSIIVVFLPDIKNVLNFFFRGLFYISGVLFDVTHLPENLQYYLQLNPLSVLVETQRNLLLNQEMPHMWPLLIILAVSLAALFFGVYLHNRFDKLIVKLI